MIEWPTTVDEGTEALVQMDATTTPRTAQEPARATRVPMPDLATVDEAIALYRRDVALVREAKRRRVRRKYTGRRDVAWLVLWTARLIKTYDMATTFALTHIGGRVSREVAAQRAVYCEHCTHRRARLSANLNNMPAEGPVSRLDRCRGWDAAGRPCDCPDDPVWRPAALEWQIRLRFFACPLGHFDEGNYVPDPPEDWADSRAVRTPSEGGSKALKKTENSQPGV